ncbi:DUF1825 domain-containing protein [Synechococcus phage S-CAM3]|jgi:type IV secretory pathway VirD2 relaxase|uniref:DUF1825 domain-containing protein n=1 Tax=Synechococcus phage S-CAM3 TaxID=1883366 RepID=A0A1D8KJF3_9CAUD|nr:DUF1825 domain-containing protein [Synechococcus phage S-CAM3]AOV58744.1 DUF1825 domain-containing protein [Synechococcus phage S-CAM3]AOV58983.1 DUF1825 domain-containing protein [Synechococcus phage S-CAM3]AOV59223.1 DUF1825 domain-containing protein [Synechococcus phage S-CAM3]
MSDFFTSEMVQGDLQELAKMQEYCMKSMVVFPALSPEKKMEYFNVLQEMIEKQKVFYARLKLSGPDNQEAQDMADSIKQAAMMYGASEHEDANVIFDDLISKVEMMKKALEAEGS